MHTIDELRDLQAAPLSVKILLTQTRLREWVREYGIDGVYVSFSGGKDSTVLLDIARKIYPDIKAVFVDTGLEYPEIKQFVKAFDNVDWLKPKKNFKQVITEYGYPFPSKDISRKIYSTKQHLKEGKETSWAYAFVFGTAKDKDGRKSRFCCDNWKFLLDAPFDVSNNCCNVMKKAPAHKYERETGRKAITAQLAEESNLRTQKWLKNGCNAFDAKRKISNPMSFWTEQDVLHYIYENKLPICSVYGEIVPDTDGQLLIECVTEDTKLKSTGAYRTGCMFCMFGVHLDKHPNRFERMKKTHPKIYDYCMKPVSEGGLGLDAVLNFVGVEH